MTRSYLHYPVLVYFVLFLFAQPLITYFTFLYLRALPENADAYMICFVHWHKDEYYNKFNCSSQCQVEKRPF